MGLRLSLLCAWHLWGLFEHLLEGKLPFPTSSLIPPPAKAGNENGHWMLCAQGRGRSPTYNLADLETSTTSLSFLMSTSNVCWVQGTERSLLRWDLEKGWWGHSSRTGELRALLIYLIYFNLMYLITPGISSPLPQTQLVEGFCVISYPLVPSPVSEDRIFPPISRLLEINYNSNVFIEWGTNISPRFPQRKPMHIEGQLEQDFLARKGRSRRDRKCTLVSSGLAPSRGELSLYSLSFLPSGCPSFQVQFFNPEASPPPGCALPLWCTHSKGCAAASERKI